MRLWPKDSKEWGYDQLLGFCDRQTDGWGYALVLSQGWGYAGWGWGYALKFILAI